MSEPVSALGGARFDGLCRIREAAPQGMIQLKGDLADTALREVATDLTGGAFPSPRGMVEAGGRALAWMAPDEVLLLLPYGEVDTALARIGTALEDRHHLAVNVSDARAMFAIEGAACRDVLAKLTPADLAHGTFDVGELRRSRIAQIPAAFWMQNDERIALICFRSVARYAFDVLSNAARADGAVGYFASDQTP